MIRTSLEEVSEVNGLGELPDGWKWIPLGLLCEKIIGGGTPDRNNSSYWGGSIPWASVKDLKHDEIVTTQESITIQGLENSSTKLVEPGTVIVATRISLGKVSAAKTRLAINQDLKGLVLVPNVLDKYLTYNLKSRALEIERKGTGATVKGIKLDELKLLRIPIPFPNNPNLSRDIQHRIVSRIESLLTELRGDRQLIDEMRRDTNRFMKITLEEIFERIDSTRQPLINVIESPPRNGWSPQCDDNPNGTPVLKLGAVLRFRYNPDEVKRTSLPTAPNAHYWLQPGDILISRSNTLELVGHAAIYSGTPFPCIYPDLMMRVRVDKSKADSRFLVYWFQSKEVRHFIQSRASGASPTMKKINQGHVLNIPFPVISVEEQRWVANHLDSIQSEVDEMLKTMEQDARLLERLEQSILEKAFQGQL